MKNFKERKKVLITGASRGLGYALAEEFMSKGWDTINLGRNTSDVCNQNLIIDLSELNSLNKFVKEYSLGEKNKLDLIILNAGTLGEVKNISLLSEESIMRVLKINFLSNKVILDHFLKSSKKSNLNIIAISSGASQRPISGWSSYCISKASLNMLISCYSNEFPQHHFVSLCPGLVKTDMQKEIYDLDHQIFPDLLEIKKTYKLMPSPREVATLFMNKLEKIEHVKSGNFIKLNEI